MRHVSNSEYRLLRDLRVKENEGGEVLETLAAGCVVILFSSLCSVVSCYLWPTIHPPQSTSSSTHSSQGTRKVSLPFRMLRRRLVLESLLLILPFQILLSSGAPFSDGSDFLPFSSGTPVMRAAYTHSTLLISSGMKVLGFSSKYLNSPQLFTFELLLWAVALLLLICVVLRLAGSGSNAFPCNQLGAANAWRQDFAVYRGSLMLMTCMSILAVDFSFFPSRFMKTEAFGVSLMDVGVASFMMSSGIAGVPRASEINQLLTQWVCALLGKRPPKALTSLASKESPAQGLASFLRQTKQAKRLLEKRSLTRSDSDALLDVLAPSQQLQQIEESIRDGSQEALLLSPPVEWPGSKSPQITCETERQSVDLLRTIFKPSLLLAGLGLCRALAVNIFDHPQHLTEYGVHWNFFFTLAVLPLGYLSLSVVAILASLGWDSMACYCRPWLGQTITKGVTEFIESHAFRTMMCIAFHQLVLSCSGLTEFILGDNRDGILAANKEGICSILGFTAIYSAGIDVGTFLRRGSGKQINCRVALFLAFLVSMAAHWVCDTFVQRSSRRLCNSGYIFFSIGFNFLTGFCLACIPNTLDGLRPKSVVLDSINDNQLVIFLVSNVLVGLLNQATQTIFVSVPRSHALLLGYTLYGCVLGWKLKRAGIRVK